MVSGAVGRGGNPWLSIWFHPQQAIKQVVQQRPRRGVLLLAIIGGISIVLMEVMALFEFKALSPEFALFALVAGSILGVFGLYLNAALLRLSGILLGGAASQQNLRAALAWAQTPLAVSLVIMLAMMATAFAWPLAAEANDTAKLVLALGLIVAAILNLWAIFLSIRTIGAVQSFGFFRSVLNLILAIVLALIFAVGVRIFAFQPFNIPSSSMAPTVVMGDYLFANKTSYGYGRYSFPIDLGFNGRYFGAEPERGDVIVFRLRKDGRTDYIKRVIGLPGDTVQMVGGELHINGKAVERQRIEDYALNEDGRERAAPRYRETLPNGVSYDTLDLIQGSASDDTAVFNVPAGHYFVVGDNRDNSSDSRFSQIGYVAHDDLVGHASVIYFSSPQGSGGKIARDRMFRIPR